MLKYKRVSLKLSGEAMGGGKTIDFAAVAAICLLYTSDAADELITV